MLPISAGTGHTRCSPVSGFQLRTEYATDPSVYYIDYRLGGAPSNKAPREAQTGSHMQHLSSVDRDAYRRIYGREPEEAEVKS